MLAALKPSRLAVMHGSCYAGDCAAALSELEDTTSEEILEEMDSAEKTEVRELLEFEDETAGGMMNTEYGSLHENASVADAMGALRGNEDLLETLNTLFLVDAEERLTAAIPLARLFIAGSGVLLKDLASSTLFSVSVDERQDRGGDAVGRARDDDGPVDVRRSEHHGEHGKRRAAE